MVTNLNSLKHQLKRQKVPAGNTPEHYEASKLPGSTKSSYKESVISKVTRTTNLKQKPFSSKTDSMVDVHPQSQHNFNRDFTINRDLRLVTYSVENNAEQFSGLITWNSNSKIIFLDLSENIGQQTRGFASIQELQRLLCACESLLIFPDIPSLGSYVVVFKTDTWLAALLYTQTGSMLLVCIQLSLLPDKGQADQRAIFQQMRKGAERDLAAGGIEKVFRLIHEECNLKRIIFKYRNNNRNQRKKRRNKRKSQRKDKCTLRQMCGDKNQMQAKVDNDSTEDEEEGNNLFNKYEIKPICSLSDSIDRIKSDVDAVFDKGDSESQITIRIDPKLAEFDQEHRDETPFPGGASVTQSQKERPMLTLRGTTSVAGSYQRPLGVQVKDLHWTLQRFIPRDSVRPRPRHVPVVRSLPPPIRENLRQRMQERAFRIASMVHLVSSLPLGVVELADAGLYYDEDTDEICCYKCSWRISRRGFFDVRDPANTHLCSLNAGGDVTTNRERETDREDDQTTRISEADRHVASEDCRQCGSASKEPEPVTEGHRMSVTDPCSKDSSAMAEQISSEQGASVEAVEASELQSLRENIPCDDSGFYSNPRAETHSIAEESGTPVSHTGETPLLITCANDVTSAEQVVSTTSHQPTEDDDGMSSTDVDHYESRQTSPDLCLKLRYGTDTASKCDVQADGEKGNEEVAEIHASSLNLERRSPVGPTHLRSGLDAASATSEEDRVFESPTWDEHVGSVSGTHGVNAGIIQETHDGNGNAMQNIHSAVQNALEKKDDAESVTQDVQSDSDTTTLGTQSGGDKFSF